MEAAGANGAAAAAAPAAPPAPSDAPEAPPVAAHELSLRAPGTRELVGLELPVYVQDPRAMLRTVGGLETLQRTHESKSQFLAVKLRPNEPSCKPLFADLTKTQMLLVRVVRKKKKKRKKAKQLEQKTAESTNGTAVNGSVANGHVHSSKAATSTEPNSSAATVSELRVELVGLVREKYVCEGVADFQYLTARRFFPREATSEPAPTPTRPFTPPIQQLTPTHTPSVNVASHVWPPSESQRALKASLRPYMAIEREEELEMIPEVFSKVDLPLKYEFRQRSGYQPSESAKKSASTMTYLNFHDEAPAPQAPRVDQPATLRRRSVGASDGIDERVTDQLTRKLDEKPVWLRSKLFAGMDAAEKRAARRIVRQLCYVFVDGPWRGSWIRMGYDPRSTHDSAKYQVVELRNNRELVHAKVTHPNRKRTKKFAHPKGPRIVKVTQTSASESAQSSKRRRKERFTRGETRRSYLVDPDSGGDSTTRPAGFSMSPAASPPASAATGGGGGNDQDDESDNTGSDNDQQSTRDEVEQLEDAMDAVSVSSNPLMSPSPSSAATPGKSPASLKMADTTGGATYEIFGVQLSSANVLFQLDEIDDDEVRAWMANFIMQESPSLLGGWYSTHMFLPLREMIRFRIAALVGRSKAELETRRSRLEALKKQSLSDYTDERAGVSKKREPKGKRVISNSSKSTTAAGGNASADGSVNTQEDAIARAQEEEELAFEQSLARQHVANSIVGKLAADDGDGEVSAVENAEAGAEGAMNIDERTTEGETKDADQSVDHDEEEVEDEMEDDSERRRQLDGDQDDEDMLPPSSPSGESEASTNFSGGELADATEDLEDEDDAGPSTEYAF